ncbi:MAG TPA: hypothetical protein VJU60_10075 [Thermoleophilaceae bacterium]|nr:hypothetical protein [Thermoleophilaceae bacterium]
MRKLASLAFERRIARLLAMDRAVARELLAAAWRRDNHRLMLRAVAFVLATTRVASRVMPGAIRERAIRGFMGRLLVRPMDDLSLPLAYAGHARTLDSPSGLLPS